MSRADALTPALSPPRAPSRAAAGSACCGPPGGGPGASRGEREKQHDERVRRVAAEVRRRAGAREQVSLAKKEVSHFVPNPFDPRHDAPKVDVRDLREILELDPERRLVRAEPGLAFSDLVRATLAHGLIPKLVPELKTITVGGAVAGCSVESMSYKHGGFHDSCTRYEVVTGTGDVLSVSPEEDPELFHMLHGSYGTLGILTELELALVPAKPFVRMQYLPFGSFRSLFRELLIRVEKGDQDFVDAIVHARNRAVLCLGWFVDEAPYTSDYTFLHIFYKSTAERREDYLTTEDYLFRYDTECHWLTRTLPGLEWKIVRLLLGKLLLGSTNLLTWSRRLRPILKWKTRPEVVVDVFIPERTSLEFAEWYEREIDFYPLWVVPYRMPDGPYPWIDDEHGRKMGGKLSLDFAIYGKRNDTPGVNYHEVLERKVLELGGVKTLISENYYDEATFWRIYARERYERVKRRVDPHGLFKGLFEKFAARRMPGPPSPPGRGSG